MAHRWSALARDWARDCPGLRDGVSAVSLHAEILEIFVEARNSVGPFDLLSGTRAGFGVTERASSGKIGWTDQRGFYSGIRKGQAKLCDTAVRTIRGSKLSNRRLATMFGVHHSTVGAIKNRKSYSWVSE